MELSRATEAEKTIEPEVRQLVFGSAPPLSKKRNRRPKLYRTTTAEEFPRLVGYVRDKIAVRFGPLMNAPDSTAWWVVECVLRAAPDFPTVNSSIAERRLIAAKHLLVLGNDYSDEFTVLAENGKAQYSIGALRRILQGSPRQDKGIPDGAKRYRGPFEKTKTLRMSLAACIVSESTDQSTLDWSEDAARELALTVTMRLTRFISETVSYEEFENFIQRETALRPRATVRSVHTHGEAARREFVAVHDLTPDINVARDIDEFVRSRIIRTDLPRSNARFVARNDLLRSIDEGGDPIILTGSPGVGKTSLALEWANSRRERFPDGQLYLNLQGFGQGDPLEPMDAISRLLGRVGVSDNDMPPSLEEREALWRSISAKMHILLVLDNASSSRQVRSLLPASACTVLITSRRQLTELIYAHGARRVEVDLLSMEECLDLLRAHLGSRVDDELTSARSLVSLCGRLPLALAVVAASLAVRNASLYQALRELTGSGGIIRHAVGDSVSVTISSVFDWSIDSLTEKTRFAYLELAATPLVDFSHELVSKWRVSDHAEDDATYILRELIDHNLLLEDFQHADRMAVSRYRYHDLLREHARDRSQRELDTNSPSRAMVGVFLTLVRERTSALISTRTPEEARGRRMYLDKSVRARLDSPTEVQRRVTARSTRWLSSERHNLVAVHDWATGINDKKLRGRVAILRARYAIFVQDWASAGSLGVEAFKMAVFHQNLSAIRSAKDVLRVARAGIEAEYHEALDPSLLDKTLEPIESLLPKTHGEINYRQFKLFDAWIESEKQRGYASTRARIQKLSRDLATVESGGSLEGGSRSQYVHGDQAAVTPADVRAIIIYLLGLEYVFLGELEHAAIALESYSKMARMGELEDEFHVRRIPRAATVLAKIYLRDPDKWGRAVEILDVAEEAFVTRGLLDRAKAIRAISQDVRAQLDRGLLIAVVGERDE